MLELLRIQAGISRCDYDVLRGLVQGTAAASGAANGSVGALLEHVQELRITAFQGEAHAHVHAKRVFMDVLERRLAVLVSCVQWHAVNAAGSQGSTTHWKLDDEAASEAPLTVDTFELLGRVEQSVDQLRLHKKDAALALEQGNDDTALAHEQHAAAAAKKLRGVLLSMRASGVDLAFQWPAQVACNIYAQLLGLCCTNAGQESEDDLKEATVNRWELRAQQASQRSRKAPVKHRLSVIFRRMATAASPALAPEANPAEALPVPARKCADLSVIAEGSADVSSAEEEAQQGQDSESEEEDLPELHTRWQDITACVAATRNHLHVTEEFHTLLFLRRLLVLVQEQANTLAVSGLETPAMTGAGGQQAVTDLLEQALSALERAADEARDSKLFARVSDHARDRLLVWCGDYHQADASVVSRCMQLLDRLLQLKEGRARRPTTAGESSMQAFENSYLRDKTFARLLSRSAALEFARVRADYPADVEHLSEQHWQEFGEELCVSVRHDATVLCPALAAAGVHATPAEATLPKLADCFSAEVRAFVSNHPAVTPMVQHVLRVVRQVVASLTQYSSIVGPRCRLADHLPDLPALYAEKVSGWVRLQTNKVDQWLNRIVEMDGWALLEHANGKWGGTPSVSACM